MYFPALEKYETTEKLSLAQKQYLDLDLEIDHKIQWTKHVEEQSKKIFRDIAILRKIRLYVPQETLQTKTSRAGHD